MVSGTSFAFQMQSLQLTCIGMVICNCNSPPYVYTYRSPCRRVDPEPGYLGLNGENNPGAHSLHKTRNNALPCYVQAFRRICMVEWPLKGFLQPYHSCKMYCRVLLPMKSNLTTSSPEACIRQKCVARMSSQL